MPISMTVRVTCSLQEALTQMNVQLDTVLSDLMGNTRALATPRPQRLARLSKLRHNRATFLTDCATPWPPLRIFF